MAAAFRRAAAIAGAASYRRATASFSTASYRRATAGLCAASNRRATASFSTASYRRATGLGGLALTGLAVTGLTLTGCSASAPARPLQASSIPPAAATPAARAPASPSPGVTASPTPGCTGIAPGFSCVMQQRITEARHYLAGRHGSIGIVLDDRVTGAVWHNGHVHTLYPAASTMKLAVMTDLLLRNRRGSIHLTSADRREMYQALHTSNDDDANALWNTYEDASFQQRIQVFGMTRAHFVGEINWGFMYCTPRDLDHLMNYVLAKAPAGVRDYLVRQLQHVSVHDQHWGVWGAGPANQPGNKDGWEQDPIAPGNAQWITNTVGFAGPAQEYTLSIMDNLHDYGGTGPRGFFYGTNTLTQIASILFQGHHTTAPHPQPSYVP
jgi:hypothetical protein